MTITGIKHQPFWEPEGDTDGEYQLKIYQEFYFIL